MKKTILSLVVIFMTLYFSVSSLDASDKDQYMLVVATTSLTTVVVYCRSKHGSLDTTQGRRCFSSARDMLSSFPFNERAERLREQCPPDETFNTCLTPQLAADAAEMVDFFKRSGL